MKALTLQTTDLIRLMQNAWTQRAIQAINLLLVVWISWLLATLSWRLIPELPPLEIAPVDTKAPPVRADSDKQLVSQLSSWHIFGEVRKEPAAPEKPNVSLDAPDTHLKLVLRGVLASDAEELAHAIIADQLGKEEMYAIGGTLPGNAELREVHPDRVILMRDGRYETLRLPRDGEAGPGRRASTTTGSRTVKPQTSNAERVSSIHQSPRRGPKSLSQLVHIKRKKDAAGKDIGYTVHPGVDPGLFEQVGLRAGDVLTQINDITTDTPANLWRALQSSKSGASVTLTVMRGDQEETISFKLPE